MTMVKDSRPRKKIIENLEQSRWDECNEMKHRTHAKMQKSTELEALYKW